MAFQPGNRVVYGTHGVCDILEIEERIINRNRTSYYVLCPSNQNETRFYIPTHNQNALAKLRPLLSAQQLEELLKNENNDEDIWSDDENLRKQRYRELIGSGDRSSLICMLRALYRHKANQITSGKKFHISDENFLRDAERILSSEVSIVLGITQVEAVNYIRDSIDIK